MRVDGVNNGGVQSQWEEVKSRSSDEMEINFHGIDASEAALRICYSRSGSWLLSTRTWQSCLVRRMRGILRPTDR